MHNPISYEKARERFLEDITNEEDLYKSYYVEFVTWCADNSVYVEENDEIKQPR